MDSPLGNQFPQKAVSMVSPIFCVRAACDAVTGEDEGRPHEFSVSMLVRQTSYSGPRADPCGDQPAFSFPGETASGKRGHLGREADTRKWWSSVTWVAEANRLTPCPLTPLMYSRRVSAKLKCPVRANSKIFTAGRLLMDGEVMIVRKVRVFWFSQAFRVGEVIESGAGPNRKNAARLKILGIEDEFVRHQSIVSASKSRMKYSYILSGHYPRLL
jgi:hypothetical protein